MKRKIRSILTLTSALLLLPSCADTETDVQTSVKEETGNAVITENTESREITEITEETAQDTAPEETTAAEPSASDRLAEILRSAEDIQADAKQLCFINRQYSEENPTVLLTASQGGTTDGKFYYQCFLKINTDNQAENIVRVVKYNIKMGKVVKISHDLPLCHANDIVLVPEDNQIYIVHNTPQNNTVSVLDADTLEFIETKTLPVNIYSMSYLPSTQKFVVGISGGQNFSFLDKDLVKNAKQNRATTKTTGYVTQGCSCDENFVYFVLYKENVITVYDWKGKFVTVIHFDVGNIEPENISVVDGKIYVGCGNAGMRVFEITPKAAE